MKLGAHTSRILAALILAFASAACGKDEQAASPGTAAIENPVGAEAGKDADLHAEEPAKQPTESQRFAWGLLMRMAEFLAAQDGFGVTVQAGFDVLQNDGRKIEFVESRSIQLQRPDHLRIRETASEGHGHAMLFDGEFMTVWNEDAGVFAQVPQPETVDDAIIYFIRELGMRLPLAPLVTTWAPVELARRVHTIDYVERTAAFGVSAHHISARTADIDFQVWITDGSPPVPLRIVLTYPEAGQPQYWAQFSGWDLDPVFEDGAFELDLPEGLERIVFAAQIPAFQQAGQEAGAGDQP